MIYIIIIVLIIIYFFINIENYEVKEKFNSKQDKVYNLIKEYSKKCSKFVETIKNLLEKIKKTFAYEIIECNKALIEIETNISDVDDIIKSFKGSLSLNLKILQEYSQVFSIETRPSFSSPLYLENDLSCNDICANNIYLENDLKHFVGRPSPIYFAERLTKKIGGAKKSRQLSLNQEPKATLSNYQEQ